MFISLRPPNFFPFRCPGLTHTHTHTHTHANTHANTAPLQVPTTCATASPAFNREVDPYFEGLVFQTHGCKVPAFCFSKLRRCKRPDADQQEYILTTDAVLSFSDGQVAPYSVHALVTFKRMAVAYEKDGMWGGLSTEESAAAAEQQQQQGVHPKILAAMLSPFVHTQQQQRNRNRNQLPAADDGRAVRDTFAIKDAWVPVGGYQPPSPGAKSILTDSAMPYEAEAQQQASFEPLCMIALARDLLTRASAATGLVGMFVLFSGIQQQPQSRSLVRANPPWLAGIVTSCTNKPAGDNGGAAAQAAMCKVLHTNGCVTWHRESSFSDPPIGRVAEKPRLIRFRDLKSMLEFKQVQESTFSLGWGGYSNPVESALLQSGAFATYINDRDNEARTSARLRDAHVKAIAAALGTAYKGFG